METCDALIVGGGPAGSTCARKLQAAGLDVVILDKQQFPRDKTCAGWITPEVLRDLELDPQAYPGELVMQPITRFRTGLIGGAEVETDYGQVVSYGIRRFEFDHFLLERSGVKRVQHEPFESLVQTAGRWVVNGRLSTPLIVGAGGHFCPVARFLGNRDGAHAAVVAAQEVEFAASPAQLAQVQVAPDRPELFFCADLEGYGWCFRKGNFLNIGLGRLNPQRISSHVKDFCEFLRERGKVGCEIPNRFHGHAYQLYERTPPKLLGAGIILIGDSAGLAYPQSGEGIRPAIESGLLAAEVILAAGGGYRQEDLQPYETEIEARFGKPRSGTNLNWLPAGALRFLAARLMASQWFSRHVVLDRWFLHRGTPALACSVTASPLSAR